METEVPTFDVSLISEQVETFYGSYSYLETIYAILGAVEKLINKLPDEIEGVSEEEAAAWVSDLDTFWDRFRWYVEASEAGEDADEVEALVTPGLFDGEYDKMELENGPSWPDIQTPWRLFNRLVRSGSESGAAISTGAAFEEILEGFWNDVASNLADELAGGEETNVEAEKAIGEAKKNSTDFPPDVVSMADPSSPHDDDGDDGRSIAPLLLGIGAILLIANKRR